LQHSFSAVIDGVGSLFVQTQCSVIAVFALRCSAK